jgi:hypothetical protein
MGRILPEVESDHLAAFPGEREIIRGFLSSFDVTWARRRRAFGSDLSVYFLKPEPHMDRAFGFESEILTVYSSYSCLEPRTMQAIEQFIAEEPARGRVNTLVVFLISESSEPLSWARQYMSSNPEARLIAAFSAEELRAHSVEPWHVRSVLASQLYQRDLFDYRLPIKSDYFFFGREDLVFDFYNAFKRSENRGLFGLRKTGKTSLLFKLERRITSASEGLVLYLDCKYPPLRSLRWDQLLLRIAKQIAERAGLPCPNGTEHPADVFLATVKAVSEQHLIALVFDEIEYVSPFSQLNPHWRNDFVPFWQSIWACQSQYRNVSVLVAGVNPTIVERDLIEGVQNPLFGIVPYRYLGGLRNEEIRRMTRVLGRPMGLVFNSSAVDYLTERYGGHPLLIRIACSLLHRTLRERSSDLPADIGREILVETEDQRESELSFYCRHVVSELRQFYPDEYELLCGLATGQLADLFELSSAPEFTSHASNYGLIGRDSTGRPAVLIPVLARFLGLEDARTAGRRTILKVVERTKREGWLRQRLDAINSNLDLLQQAIARGQHSRLFGPNSYPESHRFFRVPVCESENDFSHFANTCNRCFVESMEGYGASIGKDRYFWKEIGTEYPALSEALRRVKVYRHHRVHIRLNPAADEELQHFLTRDLEGRQPASVEDLWFQLQQCTLDELLIGILVELDRLS